MDITELETAVKSIFDPDDGSSSPPPIEPLSPLCFSPSTSQLRTENLESSDEETRNFILKNDGFVPKSTPLSITPKIRLKKMPRMKNAPTCTHVFKRGPNKGEVCGTFCRLGDEFCTKHKKTEKKSQVQNLDLEAIAVKTRFRKLKISKKYKLLQTTKGKEPIVILETDGKILKVRLPKHLSPIPKTGSYLKFQKTGGGERAPAMWESG